MIQCDTVVLQCDTVVIQYDTVVIQEVAGQNSPGTHNLNAGSWKTQTKVLIEVLPS